MSRLELEHINTLWFMTLGVTAISAGVLVYVLLLESALGAFSIREFYPSVIEDGDRPRIAILASDYTRNLRQSGFDGQNEGWYDHLLTNWDTYLGGSQYKDGYDWIDDKLLEEDRRLFRYDVLILPAALALSDQQIDRIKQFMEQGGGVFGSWRLGYFDRNGRERGWEAINELFSVEVTDEVSRYEGTYRSYQAIYPGTVEPGLYIPVNNVLSGIEENQFSPLSGYRWVAPLSSIPPQSDYAQADTLTWSMADSRPDLEGEPAVRVNYYSWIGDRSGRKTPYIYAGYGMEQVALLGSTPLTRDIPAGYSFFVQVYDPAIQMRPTIANTYPVGYWKDDATNKLPVPFEDNVSLVYGAHDVGRFVYTGFRRDAMGVGQVDEEDIVHIDRLFGNILHYLRCEPSVWLKDWPAPYNGGALFSGIGQSNLDYLVSVADSLERENVRGTFFVEPAKADLYRSSVENLQKFGEVGVLDNFDQKEYVTSDEVIQRFTNLRQVLEDITLGSVKSYRPMSSVPLQNSTHEALAKAGYLSVFADSIERQSVPRVLRYTNPRMTQYNITGWTDDELIAAPLGSEIDLTPLHKDIERLAREGGLYQLVFSSEGLALPSNRHLLTDIVRTLKANRFWIATSSEITTWWREQHGVKTALEKSGNSRLVLHLSNQNGEVVNQVGVTIDIGHSVDGVRIRPELIGSPVPKHELSNGNSQLFIKVAALKPQQTRLFHIDLIHDDGVPIITQSINP